MSQGEKMLLVPRELAERIAASIGYEERDELRAILAQPAEQNQGEPFAWWGFREDMPGKVLCTPIHPKEQVLHGYFDYKVQADRPLYTRADPGEVEQLRKELQEYKDTLKFNEGCWSKERAVMLDKLAERDALLREASSAIKQGDVDFDAVYSACRSWDELVKAGEANKVALKIDAHLSASAEPATPECSACQGSGHAYAEGMPLAGACETCRGKGVVDDGEITESGGIPFENGPVKCVKDCPDCKP